MRYLFATILLIISATACKSSKDENLRASTTITPRGVTPRNTNSSAGTATNNPVARPANLISGRVAGVRDNLRFVIVDFANSRMPQLDQRLHVYRLDQKVAELKVSGPYLGTTVAADITAGDAQVNDLVRDR